MQTEDNKGIANDIMRYMDLHGAEYDTLCDLFDICIDEQRNNGGDMNTPFWINTTKKIRENAILRHIETEDNKYGRLYEDALLFESPYRFESYMEYMELDRPFESKFYLPRRKTLHLVADELQKLEDRVYKFLGVSLPARTGKSTICIFFMSWIIGKRPNSHNGMSGHSGILADGFYSEVMNLTETKEYRFHNIFPRVKMESKHADKNEVNYDKPDRFPTLVCRGIDGTWTGEVDISEDG